MFHLTGFAHAFPPALFFHHLSFGELLLILHILFLKPLPQKGLSKALI